MLYYKFKNYEEFKEMFGIIKHSNNVSSRKNKILLAYIKNKELLHQAVEANDYTLLHISSMPELKKTMTERIMVSGHSDDRLCYGLELGGDLYYSQNFETDELKGVCEDGDSKAIRYVNHDNNGKVFKMKAGKFYRKIILETEFGKTLPEQVLIYLCEEFTSDWQVYTQNSIPQNKLCVDKKFWKIYSSDYCIGDFSSCMTDKEYHSFYQNAVNSSAAYLENGDGMILARCIIYNEVKDRSGKIWRLAERQYSCDNSEVLKRALVDALIRGGHIDGYKKIGAGCGDSRCFVDLDGNSLGNLEFRISCNLDYGDTLSYQDSFKWYDIESKIATNYESGDIYLDITDGSLEGIYDDYHGYYCPETRIVYCNGIEYDCCTTDLDDFTYISRLNEYHHDNDILSCPECEEYFLKQEKVYSEITDEYYCSEECCQKAERNYKEENWHFSDYNQEYYEGEEDILSYQKWNPITLVYEEKTISTQTLNRLLRDGEFYNIEGNYYDRVDEETGQPYTVLEEIEETIV